MDHNQSSLAEWIANLPLALMRRGGLQTTFNYFSKNIKLETIVILVILLLIIRFFFKNFLSALTWVFKVLLNSFLWITVIMLIARVLIPSPNGIRILNSSESSSILNTLTTVTLRETKGIIKVLGDSFSRIRSFLAILGINF